MQVVGVVGRHAVFQQGGAFQAELGRHRRGLADVVGLHGPLGHHMRGALLPCVAHQVFEFSDLVAAGGDARAVVALDPELRAAEQLREVGHGLERGRRMAELHAGKAGEVHGAGLRRGGLRLFHSAVARATEQARLRGCRGGPSPVATRNGVTSVRRPRTLGGDRQTKGSIHVHPSAARLGNPRASGDARGHRAPGAAHAAGRCGCLGGARGTARPRRGAIQPVRRQQPRDTAAAS